MRMLTHSCVRADVYVQDSVNMDVCMYMRAQACLCTCMGVCVRGGCACSCVDVAVYVHVHVHVPVHENCNQKQDLGKMLHLTAHETIRSEEFLRTAT